MGRTVSWRPVSSALLVVVFLAAAGAIWGAGIALAGPMVLSVSKQIEKQVGVGISVHMSGLSVVIGLALGVVVAALAAWLPARRASRRDITAELHGQASRDDAAPRATAPLHLPTRAGMRAASAAAPTPVPEAEAPAAGPRAPAAPGSVEFRRFEFEDEPVRPGVSPMVVALAGLLLGVVLFFLAMQIWR